MKVTSRSTGSDVNRAHGGPRGSNIPLDRTSAVRATGTRLGSDFFPPIDTGARPGSGSKQSATKRERGLSSPDGSNARTELRLIERESQGESGPTD
jgi:hypothetical protein